MDFMRGNNRGAQGLHRKAITAGACNLARGSSGYAALERIFQCVNRPSQFLDLLAASLGDYLVAFQGCEDPARSAAPATEDGWRRVRQPVAGC